MLERSIMVYEEEIKFYQRESRHFCIDLDFIMIKFYFVISTLQ